MSRLHPITWYRSLSLSIKLTFSFIIFGVIIGYITAITLTMITSRNFMEYSGKFMEEQFKTITSGQEGDIILKLAKRNAPALINAVKGLKDDSIHSFTKFKIYTFKPDTKEWKNIEINENSSSISFSPVDRESLSYINKMHNSHISSHARFFFGSHDKIHIFIDLTRSADTNRYFLHIESSRKGLGAILQNNLTHLIFFDFFLFLFSFLLGKFFSRNIVKPIRKLSQAAEDISNGNYSHRFSIKSKDEVGSLAGSLNKMAANIEDHMSEIEDRMTTMETMNRIDKAVLSSVSRNELLEKVVGYVAEQYPEVSIVVVIREEERKGFTLLSSTNDILQRFIKNEPFLTDRSFSPEILKKYKEVFQYNSREHFSIMNKNFSQFPGQGKGSILNIPLFTMDTYLGSLIVFKDSTSGYFKDMVQTISMLADQVGVALQSVRAFEEKEEILLGILLALTRSIDAKSRWTAGHSDRVAAFSQEIGLKLGLSLSEMRQLSFSSLLHDIGKIGVPEYILDKPGKLDPDELILIRTHPEKGAEILRDIPSYETIVDGVLHHHELWNGTGYPHGLGEKDIPLQARIIALADTFEAITDDRPYRKGFSLSEGLEFLKTNRGIMFDPELSDVFIDLLHTTDIYTTITEKQV